MLHTFKRMQEYKKKSLIICCLLINIALACKAFIALLFEPPCVNVWYDTLSLAVKITKVVVIHVIIIKYDETDIITLFSYLLLFVLLAIDFRRMIQMKKHKRAREVFKRR